MLGDLLLPQTPQNVDITDMLINEGAEIPVARIIVIEFASWVEVDSFSLPSCWPKI